jgi:hypothetical protein
VGASSAGHALTAPVTNETFSQEKTRGEPGIDQHRLAEACRAVGDAVM